MRNQSVDRVAGTRRSFPEVIAELLIKASQHTPFRGTGGYAAPSADTQSGQAKRFPQAETELARVAEFFQFFRNPLEVAAALQGKRVLDFGCGYGGRTVGYATTYGAADVIGVEPFAHVIEACSAFAAFTGVNNCRFLVNDQLTIPLPDGSVDEVVSYDVFEHVNNPMAMLSELHRVLVPGGRVFLVFTPYYGAFSHHLNYITRLPGLQWIFDPHTLVNAVNRLLRDGGEQRFGTAIQPEPSMSFGGARRSLPAINGLTGEEFLSLCGDFHAVETHCTPLLAKFPVLGRAGSWLNRLARYAGPRIEEALSFNMVCVLEKPRSSPV